MMRKIETSSNVNNIFDKESKASKCTIVARRWEFCRKNEGGLMLWIRDIEIIEYFRGGKKGLNFW